MTSSYMRMSRLYAPTLREDPQDADIASHRLLLRAGCIRKTASGLYSYPTIYVVDKNGQIVGSPIVGAITSGEQQKALDKLIDQAIASSQR